MRNPAHLSLRHASADVDGGTCGVPMWCGTWGLEKRPEERTAVGCLETGLRG